MRTLLVFKSIEAFNQAARAYAIDGDELTQLKRLLCKVEMKTSTNGRRSLHVLFVQRGQSPLPEHQLILPKLWMSSCVALYTMPYLEFGLAEVKCDVQFLEKLDVTQGELERVLRARIGKFPLYSGRMGIRLFDSPKTDLERVRDLVTGLSASLRIAPDHRFSGMSDSDMDQIVEAVEAVMQIKLTDDVQEALYFAFDEDQPTLGTVARWLHQQAPFLRMIQDGKDLVDLFINEVYVKRGHRVPSHIKAFGLASNLLIGNGKLKCGVLVEFVELLESKGIRLNRTRIDDHTTYGVSLKRWFDVLLESANFSQEEWMLSPFEIEHAQIFLHQDKYYLVKGTNIEFFPVRNVTLDRDRLGKSPETMFVEGNCTYQPCATKQEAELELARHYAKQLENVV